MDLFQPDSDENPEADDKLADEPEAETEEHTDTGAEGIDNEPDTPIPASRTRVETHQVRPPLLRWLAAIVAVLIIAFLLVLLARWIYHATHNNSSSNTPSISQKSPSGAAGNKTSGSQPANNNKPAAPSGGSSQITNTGPGNVPAIFAGSALAAASLHFIWQLRRRRS